MALKTRRSEEDESRKAPVLATKPKFRNCTSNSHTKRRKKQRKRTQQGTTYLTVGSGRSDGQKRKQAKRQDLTVGSLRIDPCHWMAVESDGVQIILCSRSLNGLMEIQPFDVPERWRSDRWISAASEQQQEPFSLLNWKIRSRSDRWIHLDFSYFYK
jgi:hypothetical protein